MKLKINVSHNANRVLGEIRLLKNKLPEIFSEALSYAANMLLDDCRKYVPLLTGALRDSGHLEKDLKSYVITLIWNAENPDNGYIYAEKQYKEVLQHINGRFAAEWVKKAVDENPQKYTRIVALIVRRELARRYNVR